MRFALAAVLAASAPALVACASDPTTEPTRDAKVVCTSEAPTGSNLRVRRCWTEEQTTLQQQDARAIGEAASRVRQGSERR